MNNAQVKAETSRAHVDARRAAIVQMRTPLSYLVNVPEKALALKG